MTTNETKKYGVYGVVPSMAVIFLLFAFAYQAVAFNQPAVPVLPPIQDEIGTPLNVGSDVQTKPGNLWITGTSDSEVSLSVDTRAEFGKLQIGLTTPRSSSIFNNSLLVGQDLKANQFCLAGVCISSWPEILNYLVSSLSGGQKDKITKWKTDTSVNGGNSSIEEQTDKILISKDITEINSVTATNGQGALRLAGLSYNQTVSVNTSKALSVDNQGNVILVNIDAVGPTSFTCSASPTTAMTGDTINFTTSGGSGSYSWSASGADSTPGTGSTFSTTYSSIGSKTVTVTNNGNTATCNAVTITARPIALACTPSDTSVAVGSLVTFNASGGSGNYTWSAPGAVNMTGSGSTFATSYSSVGSKIVTLTSGSETANCSAITVTSAAVPLACVASRTSAYQDQQVTFTASGGTGSYAWSSPNGAPVSGTGATFTTSFATPHVDGAVTLNSDAGVCPKISIFPTVTGPGDPTSPSVVSQCTPTSRNVFSWTAPVGTLNPTYYIKRCKLPSDGSGCAAFNQVSYGINTQYVDSDVVGTELTSYLYRVAAGIPSATGVLYSNYVPGSGLDITNPANGGRSTGPNCTTPTVKPSKPSDLAIVRQCGPAGLKITWQPSTAGSGTNLRYQVQRCTGASCNFSNLDVNATDIVIAEYIDGTATDSTLTYNYRVRAWEDLTGGTISYGDFSDPKQSVGPSCGPTLIVDDASCTASPPNGGIKLRWLPFTNLPNGTVNPLAYALERCTGQSCTNFGPLTSAGFLSDTTYSDSINDGEEYRYRLVAFDSDDPSNRSEYSNSVGATAPLASTCGGGGLCTQHTWTCRDNGHSPCPDPSVINRPGASQTVTFYKVCTAVEVPYCSRIDANLGKPSETSSGPVFCPGTATGTSTGSPTGTPTGTSTGSPTGSSTGTSTGTATGGRTRPMQWRVSPANTTTYGNVTGDEVCADTAPDTADFRTVRAVGGWCIRGTGIADHGLGCGSSGGYVNCSATSLPY